MEEIFVRVIFETYLKIIENPYDNFQKKIELKKKHIMFFFEVGSLRSPKIGIDFPLKKSIKYELI